ncbi:atrial natriuretic peptide-converting enzyme-like [Dreissena polymorpha]|uniref:FZ domain-containing protein n=1 Tax=Dreissena polymorpha TaxID=45954 RepID=A0A9D4D9Z1_DREPO|nr:atrial natriuretic peptide-converting enzyme-like [Dreissena polymorpha]KAH3741005.1 hypothetical protein DPMN_047723 [Dreissena polymorpha]
MRRRNMARIQWLFNIINVIALVTSQLTDISIVTSHPEGLEEIVVPMCKNFLPYTHTRLPNSHGHTTQVEVYRHIEHYWSYMDYGCSINFRKFVCAMFLPEYDVSTSRAVGPCKELCSQAKRKCKKVMQQLRSKWPKNWKCNKFKGANSNACLKPWREPNPDRGSVHHLYCSPIRISQCQNLPYHIGSLPNLFLQRNITELQTEFGYYDSLLATGCHAHLRLFLCGTYMPFCVHNANPFTIPCRELCEEVEAACEVHFALLNGGLPWPQKVQCHRFPLAESQERLRCFMPTDQP